jgi:hypothetical protein
VDCYDGSSWNNAVVGSGSVNSVSDFNTIYEEGITWYLTGVAKTDQTIGTITFTPATLAVGGTTTASATATSGLAVTFTGATPTICSVNGATVTGVTAGTCTITADQTGNASYNAASRVTQNITVGISTSYIVTLGTATNVTISPSTAQTVASGKTAAFTITTASGYGAVVTGCSGTLVGTTFTTGTITADCSLTVTAVARTASSGGSAPAISDALKVLQAVAGVTQLTSADQIRYDVAPLGSSGKPVGNGVLDDADVIMILRRSIGIGSW